MPSITIVCNSYPPEIGAAPTRIYNLARLLRGAGYGVEVVCAMPNYPSGRILPGYRGKLRVKEVYEGIAVRRLPLVPPLSRTAFRRVLSMASQAASLWTFLSPHLFRKRPRLVIVSSPPLPMAAAGVAIAKAVGCKVLLNVSDLWPLSALELGAVRPGRIYKALQSMERRLYRRADGVMGQSEEILDHIRAQVSKPAFLYRNLPEPLSNPQTFQHSNAPTLQHSTPRRIIYAGQLGPVQGIAEICAGQDFAALGCELHLYGDGPERSRIEAAIRAAPARSISLHDPVPLARMPALLADFDAALVPLRTALTGAVPSKLFSAVCAGLPVVFCGGGEGARLVAEKDLGWVSAPGDAAGLQEALRGLSSQTGEEYSALRQRCLIASETIFSKQTQDERFLAFLSELL